MRWEYLRVYIGRNSGTIDSHIAPSKVMVVGDDDQKVEWKKQAGETTHQSVMTRLLRKLGDDGWELVGGYSEISSVLYFKRSKS